MNFRRLSSSDFDQILSIERSAHHHSWSPQILRDTLEGNYYFLGAKNNDTLYGFIVYQLVADEMHIHNICVHITHQKQGIGDKLLAQAIKKAKIPHCTKIILEVRQSNQQAKALYQRHQFQTIAIRKAYYQTNTTQKEDACIMCLSLMH